MLDPPPVVVPSCFGMAETVFVFCGDIVIFGESVVPDDPIFGSLLMVPSFAVLVLSYIVSSLRARNIRLESAKFCKTEGWRMMIFAARVNGPAGDLPYVLISILLRVKHSTQPNALADEIRR